MSQRDLKAVPAPDDLADALDLTEHGNVVALAQYRERVGAATFAPPQPLKPETAARLASRLATIREELIGALKELDAEREQGCEDAGIYHVALGFTALDVERVSGDLVREHGGA